MSTIETERPATAAARKPGRIGRARNRVAGLLATAAALIIVPIGAASAEPADPVDTAVSGAFGDVQDMFLTTIVPAVVALTVAVLGIVLAIKWIRKTAKTS